jgi:hypothetical protein
MQVGGAAATALLLAWTLLPGITALYVVWTGLGLCMAATLYEPAFVIVGRAYRQPAARLRALALITLFGGLASTVALPATAFLTVAFEWRAAVLGLAITLGVSTWLTRHVAFRQLATHAALGRSVNSNAVIASGANSIQFAIVAGMFTLATLASAALMTNLVPALAERGVPPTTAALLGGFMGVMQLPGRALLMNGMLAGSPALLLALSLALHAAGLGLVAAGYSTALVAAGTTVFALGAGLTTLVRAHLVQTMFKVESAGLLNGRIARQQQFARAVGPFFVAWLASKFSYSAVITVLAVTFCLAASTAFGALSHRRGLPAQGQAA